MGNNLEVKSSPATRRHRITPDAGHALEKLAHAIEYLADELVDKSTPLSADNERIRAIQILMALNRQVYFECPLVPTVGEWLLSHLPRLDLLVGKSPDRDRLPDIQVTRPAELHHPPV
jgi:hypothetical protein